MKNASNSKKVEDASTSNDERENSTAANANLPACFKCSEEIEPMKNGQLQCWDCGEFIHAEPCSGITSKAHIEGMIKYNMYACDQCKESKKKLPGVVNAVKQEQCTMQAKVEKLEEDVKELKKQKFQQPKWLESISGKSAHSAASNEKSFAKIVQEQVNSNFDERVKEISRLKSVVVMAPKPQNPIILKSRYF